MNTSKKELESILDTYSLEEILESNDLLPVDALEFLLIEGFIELPNIRPLDVDEWDDTYEIEELGFFES